MLSRLARPGVSQTSNGVLESGIHTQAVSLGVVMIRLYLDILLLSSPLSRHFSGQKSEFTAWTRNARYYAKGVGFLSAFVWDPPQYIPVQGELDTENSVLGDGGYSRERVNKHALAWNFLSTALKSNNNKSIRDRCTSPREAWDALLP